jgi:hypothetical protein
MTGMSESADPAHPTEWREALTETLKRSAVALKKARVPFALGGGYATYARGGSASENDVDFLLREEDAETALAALEQAGLRAERPPEDWLLKAYDGDRLVDLIWRMGGRPVDDDLLSRADELDVCSVFMPVAGATDLVIGKLLSMSAHYCDFTKPLALARALREQVDWALVRAATAESPFAEAFLLLGERLAVLPPAGEESTWLSLPSPTEEHTSSRPSPKTPESASLASA